jgi:hypothetical protein
MRRPLAPPTPRQLALACVLVALPGLARTLHFEFRERSRAVHRPVDERFAPVRAQLPTGARIGFLTDDRYDPKVQDSERFYRALYALAPRPLVLDAEEAELWIADFADAAKLEAAMRARGLVRVASFEDGRLAILRRAAP